ncbi:MAG: hypothetical protein ACFCD0_08675 [Gemmataceae bacterium]
MTTIYTPAVKNMWLSLALTIACTGSSFGQGFGTQRPLMPTLSDIYLQQRLSLQYQARFAYGSLWYRGYPSFYAAPAVSRFGLSPSQIPQQQPLHSMSPDTEFLNPLNQLRGQPPVQRNPVPRRGGLPQGPINPFNGQRLNQ